MVLLAYATSLSMPVLPYVADSVAHTFWLYQHIATVHYENGQYHTHYEAAEIAKKTGTEKGPTHKQMDVANEHIVTVSNYNLKLPIKGLPSYAIYQSDIAESLLPSDDLPPKL